MTNQTSTSSTPAPAEIPTGAVQALTTAATGALALEIAFLGYWGFGTTSGQVPWHWSHLLVLLAFLIAFVCLAGVAWLITKPGLTVDVFSKGRLRYLWGVAALGIGVFLAVSISRFY